MTKKIMSEIVDIIVYYICSLLVCLFFKWVGWLERDVFIFALGITIGWYIARAIIKLVKKK